MTSSNLAMINTKNLAYRAIRRSNLTNLLLGIVMLLAVAGVAAISTVPYWLGTLNPTEVSRRDIANQTVSVPSYGVTVEGVRMIDTGYYYESKLYGLITTQTKNYGALLLNNDQFLLVEMKGVINESEDTFTGALEPIPSDVRTEIIEDIYRDEPSLSGAFVPMMLTTVQDEWFIGTAAVGILGVLGLFFTGRAVTRIINADKHPIIQNLARYGDPHEVSQRVESELLLSERRVGQLRFTKNWLVYTPTGDFKAMRYDDLAWVYKQITNGRYGKTYAAHILDRHGVMVIINAKEKVVDEMIQAITEHAPHTIVGYSVDINAMWQKNRAEFMKAVDARKNRTEE